MASSSGSAIPPVGHHVMILYSHLHINQLLTILNLIFHFSLQLASDAVYLLCVNGLGLYFRLMSEVAIRRTFLDRRACLESNSKVEYEKQQEVSSIRNKIFTLNKLQMYLRKCMIMVSDFNINHNNSLHLMFTSKSSVSKTQIKY
jgi:hypothetical protein